jgi:hypothetical protein
VWSAGACSGGLRERPSDAVDRIVALEAGADDCIAAVERAHRDVPAGKEFFSLRP